MTSRCLGLTLMLALSLSGVANARATVGKAAPSYTVTLMDRTHVTQAQLQGKVVILNYWATWCAPCRREMVVMENFLRTHPGADLRIFAINTEDGLPKEVIKKLRDGLSFPVAYRLAGGGYGPIGGAIPTSYVIDRAGVLRKIELGAFDDSDFDETVTPLLAEPVPAAP
jgi:cytochrome c biogenesis protein CcmG/thiol:disulfide interchange protein DsbE